MHDYFRQRGPQKSLLSTWYDGSARTAVPLKGPAATQSSEVVLARAGDQKWGPSGAFDVGFITKNTLLRGNPQIRRNFRSVLNEATGGAFGPKDMQQIEREVIDDVDILEAQKHFHSPPPRTKDGGLLLDGDQRRIVEKSLAGFPTDELGKRARAEYRKAVEAGRIRFRK